MAMRSEAKIVLPAAVLAGLLAACASVDPGLGEAVRYDMAAQTIDPDPVYPADALNPGYYGEKAQKATERYRKGQTKPLRIEQTSSGSSGGGGSGQ
jgi:hypothetical protein